MDAVCAECGAEPDQEWLTVPELAKRYRKSPATIRYWKHIGYGPVGVKVGTTVLYSREDVEAFDAELKAQAQAERAAMTL
jgi:DNA-binding transcriptional MerR regulator